MSRITSQSRRDSLHATPTRPAHGRSSRAGSDATMTGRRASRSREYQDSEYFAGGADRLDPFREDDDDGSSSGRRDVDLNNDDNDGRSGSGVGTSDDEVPHRDRGEALVRQRMRARQRERERQAAAAAAAGSNAANNSTTMTGSISLDSTSLGLPMRSSSSSSDDGESSDDGAPKGNVTATSRSTTTPMYRASGSHRASQINSMRRQSSSMRRQTSIARTDRTGLTRPGSFRHYDDVESHDGHSTGGAEETGNVAMGYHDEESLGSDDDDGDVEYTLKDRQDAINIEHPFGLPIWKPALYKKSRTVTRNAESALHSIPSAAAERHLLPGNLLWTIFAGWWLSAVCFLFAMLINCIPMGGGQYARVVWELGGYLFWPFGKYVEVEIGPKKVKERHAARPQTLMIPASNNTSNGALSPHRQGYSEVTFETASTPTAARSPQGSHHTITNTLTSEPSSVSRSSREGPTEASQATIKGAPRDYGALCDTSMQLSEDERIRREQEVYGYVYDDAGHDVGSSARAIGAAAYGLAFWIVIAPLMTLVCLLCWGTVFPIPMAKLTWVLIKNLAKRPLALRFRSAPKINVNDAADEDRPLLQQRRSFLRQLKPGDLAPRPHWQASSGKLTRNSRILLCTYRSMGLQYYKYTVGGVNILFINTLPFVFFTILDFFFVEPYVHRHHIKTGVLPAISSQGALFVFALGSVIPLSYFIGMAVASISAQSSIGMGAVINATFGSIVEIILYAIALTQDKARLVEGSIIGSILAGVLLMPGVSMVSGAMRRKEQRFNARSAGVTSTMLIMAIIGILTPTLFYQIYGTFQLTCNGCPAEGSAGSDTWTCKRCYYEHVPPATDPFYQSNVKGLMYTCTVVLVLSYGVGLWFSLRTHASQIWQTPMPQERQAAIAERHNSMQEGPTARELEAAASAAATAAALTATEANGGGHDAPSWTRATSLIVLLSCTVLYAIIAEILVDAVDAVLEGSGLDLKLLGVTLFALVPNATEFMNAMSFALNGNIALSMEIGSAYALQVCLIQIPAMVAFSALYQANGGHDTDVESTFTLIFPRWDVIAIIFAIFLLTYTYIESRSNYFRGTLCVLSYVVLISGFVFAPATGDTEDPVDDHPDATAALHNMTASSAGTFLVWLRAVALSLWTR